VPIHQSHRYDSSVAKSRTDETTGRDSKTEAHKSLKLLGGYSRISIHKFHYMEDERSRKKCAAPHANLTDKAKQATALATRI
jgi:hypothetical protein